MKRMDEIILEKLEGYTEEPSADLFQRIKDKRARARRMERYFRLLVVTILVAALATLVYKLLSRKTDESSLLINKAVKENARQSSVPAGSENKESTTIQFKTFVRKPAANKVSADNNSNEKNLRVAQDNTITENTETQKTENNKSNNNESETIVKNEESGNAEIACKSMFTYIPGDNGTVRFEQRAESSTGSTIYWKVDGEVKTDNPNPGIKFDKNGNYQVCLIVENSKNECYDYHCENIRVDNIPNVSQLRGRVNAGPYPLDMGLVLLYPYDSLSRSMGHPYQCKVSNNGTFEFDKMDHGFYLIQALPARHSDYYDNYFPTYYGSSVLYTTASRIHYTGSHTDIQISLIEIKNPDGLASIEGTISPEINEAWNQPLILIDNNGNPVSFTNPDADGRYMFPNVPAGDYKLFNPRNGTLTSVKSGTVSNGNSGSNASQSGNSGAGLEVPKNGSAEAGKDGSSGNGQSGTVGAGNRISLYPNPAKGFARFSIETPFPTMIHTMIYTSSFVEVHNQYDFVSGTKEITVDLSSIPPGNYFVVVDKGDGKLITSSMIKQ